MATPWTSQALNEETMQLNVALQAAEKFFQQYNVTAHVKLVGRGLDGWQLCYMKIKDDWRLAAQFNDEAPMPLVSGPRHVRIAAAHKLAALEIALARESDAVLEQLRAAQSAVRAFLDKT